MYMLVLRVFVLLGQGPAAPPALPGQQQQPGGAAAGSDSFSLADLISWGIMAKMEVCGTCNISFHFP
jgi:hypothetical protein